MHSSAILIGRATATTLVLAWAANGADVPSSLDRTDLYEMMYANKSYHSDLSVTHARELMDFLVVPTLNTSTRQQLRVLDVGCSHGRGVQLLWEHKFSASGMDLSITA
eukprot:5186801-Prymnesium_polylepis.1